MLYIHLVSLRAPRCGQQIGLLCRFGAPPPLRGSRRDSRHRLGRHSAVTPSRSRCHSAVTPSRFRRPLKPQTRSGVDRSDHRLTGGADRPDHRPRRAHVCSVTAASVPHTTGHSVTRKCLTAVTCYSCANILRTGAHGTGLPDCFRFTICMHEWS